MSDRVVGYTTMNYVPLCDTEKPMLPNQKKPNLAAEEVQTIECPACTEPTLHIVRGEEKCCLQCAADGGSTMPGYVSLSAFNRWSE